MSVFIKFVGEGKADIGPTDASEGFPTLGVIPTLVHSLCGKPDSMAIRRGPRPFLQKAARWRRVQLVWSQATQDPICAGVVYVVDTEGENVEILMQEMIASRDSRHHNIPIAIGVAHPCLESWLLADHAAIKKAFDLQSAPQLPDSSETLPAPGRNRELNPKTELVRCAGVQQRKDLSVEQKTLIAREIYDLDRLRDRCPLSFAPFAHEVITHIKPLFDSPTI